MSPYRPASHGPLQDAVESPVVLPKSPALQFVHDEAPPREYWPAGHRFAAMEKEDVEQKYPAHRGGASPISVPVSCQLKQPNRSHVLKGTATTTTQPFSHMISHIPDLQVATDCPHCANVSDTAVRADSHVLP